MIAYSLAAIIVWFCGSYFGMACDLVLLIICFLTFTLLYAIINNQANIERLMGRRHYSLAMLPVGMRRYNLLLICAGFVLVVLGLLFQKANLAHCEIRLSGTGLLFVYFRAFLSFYHLAFGPSCTAG